MKKNYLKTILICALGIFVTNCEGEDGANGINGIDGVAGIDGADGINGENGIGFEELTQYGGITLNFEGTRSDDVTFTDTAEFKFTATEASYVNSHNSVVVGASSLSFNLLRFLSAPDDIFQYTTSGINLVVNNPGESTQSLNSNIFVQDYAIVTEDLKYFTFNGSYNNTSAGVTNFVITDYNFDDTTNNLTFSFSFDVAGVYNTTGNDLSISGEVDVIVLEEI